MKILLALVCSLLVITSPAQRQNANPALKELLEQKNEKVLQERIKELTNSANEDDLLLLAGYYAAKQNEEKSKAIKELVKEKFPNGKSAFNELATAIYNEKDPGENEKNYKTLMTVFAKNPAFAGSKTFDYSRYYVALTFLGKNQPKKVLEYLEKIEDTLYKTNAYSYAAREAIETGDAELGEKLIKKTFADFARRNTPRPQGYEEYARIAARLLFLNGKYEEGFPYAKDFYESKSGWADKKDVYVDYLVATNRLKEAFPLMQETIAAGTSSAKVKAALKDAYVAVNGNENGYKELETSLYATLKENTKKQVAKKMVNLPAYDFTLKDLNGKTVSLSDYKGKVVVLDFWATWCGPCKASFPNMQLAVDHYKNDPDVVFLFIHTWETSPTAAKDAESYIRSKKYTFHVLMDTKDPVTNTNPAAAGYKFGGIPAKYIIDKTGNIRFSSLGGGAHGNDAFLEEMSTMIELAKRTM